MAPSRQYGAASSVKLVGDRYNLDRRQRVAISRCACGDDQRDSRLENQMRCADLAACSLWIDGFNVLTTIEAAMSGGVILLARDGCYRDMASMHGSYRTVEETEAALIALGEVLAPLRLSECHWLLDQPVSNSGRLKTMLRDVAQRFDWNWSVELVPDPDPV
ncbi:MAG: DUF434 domain-containing protein, partial [Pirellulales bacterium]|nr:DUF434 domain-containing protein [Pirellulales bacterium]